MKRTFLAGLALSLATSSAVSAAPAWTEFSADTVSRTDGQTVQGKLHVGREKMRMESMGNVIITRLDRNVAWVVMPQQGMYMEQPIDVRAAHSTQRELPGETERVPLGREDVDGRPAEKFRVTYTPQDGETVSAFQWIGEEGIPLKIEAADGSWGVEYRNLELGPQDEALFELPPGLRRFEMPSANDLSALMRQAGAE